MTENIGRGLFGSLRAQVRFEVNDLGDGELTVPISFDSYLDGPAAWVL
jgi:hypothetical protein